MSAELQPQYDLFEDPAITELKAEIAAERESKRKMQKCLFAKAGEVELQVKIMRDFMEVFGTSLVGLQNRIEELENATKP